VTNAPNFEPVMGLMKLVILRGVVAQAGGADPAPLIPEKLMPFSTPLFRQLEFEYQEQYAPLSPSFGQSQGEPGHILGRRLR
jgi:hypothetical protein